MHVQETNEISGSRGEANFVWRCKNCKSEHSASIKEGPFAYIADEDDGKKKNKRQKVLEIDNRGLEFVEFKPDVSFVLYSAWAVLDVLGPSDLNVR